jgi:transcriptional regulator with XRE-family HTH domain
VSTTYFDLGQRLSQERRKLGLSQKQLASAFGVDKSSVYSYEKGRRQPTAAHLMSMHELGGDVYFILTGRRMSSSMSSDWLHDLMRAIRDIVESGAWEKLDWDEREELAATFLRIRHTNQEKQPLAR